MSDVHPIRDHVIVDGSNIATEGRTRPSLGQLDEAVRAFLEEYPDTTITVVVDATFAHRINPGEKDAYEQAVLAGELVAPPAGAVGRGDAFITAIANKASATIFSNDSFQELHGDYPWLFDEGRLIGGKPVDGVGWVFVSRVPVRGVTSRRAQRTARDAKKPTKAEREKAAKAIEAEVEARRRGMAPAAEAPKRSRRRGGTKAADASPASDPTPGASQSDRGADVTAETAADVTADDAVAADAAASGQAEAAPGPKRARRRSASVPEAVNQPGPFVEFLTSHPVGAQVEGVVDRFSSHGAYVLVGEAQCYVPLRALADPPPRSAREVLAVGESRTFVVSSFDAPRRSIDLALPGHAVTGDPVSDTNPAEEATDMAPADTSPAETTAGEEAASKKAAAKRATTAKKATANKATKKATAKKASAKKVTPAKAATPAKKATVKKATPAKKATATKASAKKTTPGKKATATKASAKKATPAKKATATKASAKKATPAKKATAKKQA